MTPFEIDIMLHYYCHADDHPHLRNEPPIWRGTMQAFLDQGLLVFVPEQARDTNYPQTYRLTERGKAYCEQLQAVPLPVQIWVSPSDATVIGRERLRFLLPLEVSA
jgi:hypothetical protein